MNFHLSLILKWLPEMIMMIKLKLGWWKGKGEGDRLLQVRPLNCSSFLKHIYFYTSRVYPPVFQKMAGEVLSFYQLHLIHSTNIYWAPILCQICFWICEYHCICFSIKALHVIQNYVWREDLTGGQNETGLKQ